MVAGQHGVGVGLYGVVIFGGVRGGDDAVECFFRRIVPVAQQRIVGSSAHGPVVEPAGAVVHAPEGDAANLLPVLQEELEQGGVVGCELGLDRVGEAVGPGVGICGWGIACVSDAGGWATPGQGRVYISGVAAKGIREHGNVELCNIDLDA